MYDENLIRSIVAQVLSEVGPIPPGLSAGGSSSGGRHGVFYDADTAVRAARVAFEQLRERPIADRRKVIDIIRKISIEQCEELGLMEMEETILCASVEEWHDRVTVDTYRLLLHAPTSN